MTTPEAASERAAGNMARVAGAWAETCGIARHWSTPGLDCTLTRAPMRSFNQVFVRRPLADAAPLLAVIEEYRREGLRFRVRVTCPLDAVTEDALESAGLTPRGGIPSMVLERSTIADAGPPPGNILQVTDALALADHVAVAAEAFDWAPSDLGTVFTPSLLSVEGWRAYVAYVDGEPAATAQVYVRGAVAGLYYVGTAGRFRRRGLGEAITRHAVAAAFAQGCEIASLQASPMGRPVYERIGFETVAEYATYVPPGEDH
jgi:GNAT superfamily N-acetyltransferase